LEKRVAGQRYGDRAERRSSHDERLPFTVFGSANAPTKTALSRTAGPVRLSATIPNQEDAMKYLLLIHQGSTPTPRDPDAWAQLPQEEQQRVFADYQAINQTPGVTPGHGLDDPTTSTTVRVEDGRTLTTDGPFVELKEAVGGYLIYEADDLDAAIELAARIPAARLGGAIEIRPIVEY
jgi:hypothetical protein